MGSSKGCLRCGCEGRVKNGQIWGKQRYKCKACGYQFTRTTARGHSNSTKTLALILYLSGLSMNMTGKIIGVTAQSIMRWLKVFGQKALEELTLASEVNEVEIDEMHHFLLKKTSGYGSGKCWIIRLAHCVDGAAVVVIPSP